MEGRKVEMESRVASGEQGISSRGWKRVSRGKVATCVPAPSGETDLDNDKYNDNDEDSDKYNDEDKDNDKDDDKDI